MKIERELNVLCVYAVIVGQRGLGVDLYLDSGLDTITVHNKGRGQFFLIVP